MSDHRGPSLTPAERRILDLVAEGLTNPAIAERLGRTPHGIEGAMRGIYLKVGLNPPPPGCGRRVLLALMWRGMRTVEWPTPSAVAAVREP